MDRTSGCSKMCRSFRCIGRRYEYSSREAQSNQSLSMPTGTDNSIEEASQPKRPRRRRRLTPSELRVLEVSRGISGSNPPVISGSRTFQERLDYQKQAIENRGKLQDIHLKRTTLNRLFLFLAIETALIFSFAILQAWGVRGFHLEEWSFKLLVSATLLQITYMLQVAVKHLFPNK